MSAEERLFITEGDLTLAYLRYSKGHRTVVAMPGFGRPAQDYALMSQSLGPDYCVLSLDHFFHGFSQAPTKRVPHQPLTEQEWLALFSKLMEYERFTRFTLMGYSLGGRVALVTASSLAQHLDALVLIAPDGLRKNWWYWLTSQTWVGRKVYLRTIENPAWLHNLVRGAQAAKLISPKLARFVKLNTENKAVRLLVYNTWMFYRKIFPNLKWVGEELRQNRVDTFLFMGKYDSVIPSGQRDYLIKHVNHLQFIELDGGHVLLGPPFASKIATILKEKTRLKAGI